MAKLLDHEPRLAELKREGNPFALVTAAHLSALRTRRNAGQRFAAKRELVRLLCWRRLGAANPEQLDRWTDLVLDAGSLAEVLGGH